MKLNKIFISMLIASLFIGTIAFAEPIESRTNEEVSKAEVEKGNDFRKLYGFTLMNPETDITGYDETSKEVYGVYLTKDELATLDHRKHVLEEARRLENQLTSADLIDAFGGLYYDHQVGKLRIAVVSDKKDAEELKKIVVRAIDPNEIEFYPVDFSYNELESIQSEMIDVLEKAGVQNVGGYISPQENKIIVTAPDELERLNIILENKIIKKAFRITKTGYVEMLGRNDYTRPLIGGLTIVGPTEVCTGAFTGFRNGQYVYVTAGHCGEVGNTFYQGGSAIGTVVAKQTSGNTDALAIAKTGTNSGQLYGASRFVGFVTSYTVGDTICKSGISTNVTCGPVRATSYFYFLNGTTHMYDQVIVAASSTNGDSGSPVYYPSAYDAALGMGSGLTGILSSGGGSWGSDPSVFIFSKISNVCSTLAITGMVVGN